MFWSSAVYQCCGNRSDSRAISQGQGQWLAACLFRLPEEMDACVRYIEFSVVVMLSM